MNAQFECNFERVMKTRYKLLHERGSGVDNFPSKWIADDHPLRGEKYIIFHEMYGKQNCFPTNGSSHGLYFGTDRPEYERLCTGVKFLPEFSQKAFGTYKGYALLIQFSEDWEKMTIWGFKGKGRISYSLFKEWVYGDLPITVDPDDLPLSA